MRYEKGKITPNLVGLIPAGTKNVSLFFILHPDPKLSEPVTLEMEASRNGHPGRRAPLPLKLDNSAESAVPYLASFKGSALTPGDLRSEGDHDAGRKDSCRRSISFTVEGDRLTPWLRRWSGGPRRRCRGRFDRHQRSQRYLQWRAACHHGRHKSCTPARTGRDRESSSKTRGREPSTIRNRCPTLCALK